MSEETKEEMIHAVAQLWTDENHTEETPKTKPQEPDPVSAALEDLKSTLAAHEQAQDWNEMLVWYRTNWLEKRKRVVLSEEETKELEDQLRWKDEVIGVWEERNERLKTEMREIKTRLGALIVSLER